MAILQLPMRRGSRCLHLPRPPRAPTFPLALAGGARGGEKLPHYSNYFFGRDSTNWRSRVSHYQTVIAEEVWPRLNVEYRADKQGVETIYHVAPGADPTQIQMDYIGLDAPLRVDFQGNLVLTTSLGEVKEQAPYAYQVDGRVQKRVESIYRIIDGNRVAFEFEGFDASKELVIDPLIYSTYFGGLDGVEYINRVCVLAGDEGLLLCGSSSSSDFLTTPGSYQEHLLGRQDGFITKLSSDAREIEFSTLFGDSDYVACEDIKTMPNGDIVVVGRVSQLGQIPLTPSALDSIHEGYEGFVALFSNDASSLT